jgi:hypothetical protein
VALPASSATSLSEKYAESPSPPSPIYRYLSMLYRMAILFNISKKDSIAFQENASLCNRRVGGGYCLSIGGDGWLP